MAVGRGCVGLNCFKQGVGLSRRVRQCCQCARRLLCRGQPEDAPACSATRASLLSVLCDRVPSHVPRSCHVPPSAAPSDVPPVGRPEPQLPTGRVCIYFVSVRGRRARQWRRPGGCYRYFCTVNNISVWQVLYNPSYNKSAPAGIIIGRTAPYIYTYDMASSVFARRGLDSAPPTGGSGRLVAGVYL